MQRLFLATVLALSLAGCFDAPRGKVEQPEADALVEVPPKPSVALVPSSPPARQAPRVTAGLDVNGGAGRTFIIQETPSLDFDVLVRHLEGAASLGLVLLAPNEEPYAATNWQIEGVGEPVHRTYSVPVSSTLIETYALTGQWTAQLTLNGEVMDLIEVELQ